MNIKKTVKKIAALVAGTTMLGATIMGAMALDLSDYPAPFVADGVFDGKIVVGANAATSDVVGAIDLAASLQAVATTTSEIDVGGAAGTATVVGDSAEFKTGVDIPHITENLRSVKPTFTSLDLEGLKEGVFDTGLGSTPLKQYLKFDIANLSVVYEAEDEEDVNGDYMKLLSDGVAFEYHIEFTEGATSEVGTAGQLDDLESEILTILGAPFTIVEAKLTSTASTNIEITMLGGEVADVLRDGETKTYTIDGVDYEVTAVFIDSGSSQSAKLSVNGVLTKELTEGKTQVLGGDVTIGVQEILTNQREGLVEFYLGANKLKFTDSNYADVVYALGTVKVGTETINDAYLIVKATNQTNSELKLNFIKYYFLADDNIWVPAEHGLKEYLTEPEAMLTDTWDIYYAGLTDTGISTIHFDAVSDHSYKLRVENLNGDEYAIPLVTDKSGATLGWAYGDNDDDFIFTEAHSQTLAANLTADVWTFISDDDYFLVSDGASATKGDKAVTNVLRYKSISTSENTVTFQDLAGDYIVVSYTGTLGASATGQLIVGGATHNFWVGNTSTTATEKYALSMDLDASGAVNSAEVNFVAKGGGVIDFGTQTFATIAVGGTNTSNPHALNYTGVNVTINPDESRFDSTSADEVVKVTLSNTTTANVISATVNGTLYEDIADDKLSYRLTKYGALVEKYTPTGSNVIPEITMEYPLVQRYGQVFVTMGTVEVKEGTSTAGGTVSTTDVNPIAVGLAVLDTNAPAVGSENLIVVGGPCANTVAAEVMGNPENCAEGFEPGKAVIKLFADQNALLVAGYEAQETLGACYVLADYEDYELTGTEVEVVVADLNTITVNPVS